MRTKRGYEVDFLATNFEGTETYVQVRSDLSEPEARQRELRLLTELRTSKNRAVFLLLTLITADASISQDGTPPGGP